MLIQLNIVSDYARHTRNLEIGQKHKVLNQGISQDNNHKGKIFFTIQPTKGNLYCFYSPEVEIIKE